MSTPQEPKSESEHEPGSEPGSEPVATPVRISLGWRSWIYAMFGGSTDTPANIQPTISSESTSELTSDSTSELTFESTSELTSESISELTSESISELTSESESVPQNMLREKSPIETGCILPPIQSLNAESDIRSVSPIVLTDDDAAYSCCLCGIKTGTYQPNAVSAWNIQWCANCQQMCFVI